MSVKLKPWVLLTVIFVVGVLTGSALTLGFGSRFLHPPGEQQMRHHWMSHLTERLHLTADQQTKIQPILADAETKIHALHHEEVQRGAQIIKGVDDQISAFLTADQKVELQKLESEREKMFSSHAHPNEPPHNQANDKPSPSIPPTPQPNP